MKSSDRNSVIILLAKCAGFILFFLTQINPLLYSQLPGKENLRVHEKSFSEELYIKTDRDLYIAGEKVWNCCAFNRLPKKRGKKGSENFNIKKILFNEPDSN